jgi:hypothetical protein
MPDLPGVQGLILPERRYLQQDESHLFLAAAVAMHSKGHSHCSLDKQHMELAHSPDSSDIQDIPGKVELPAVDNPAVDRLADYPSPRRRCSAVEGVNNLALEEPVVDTLVVIVGSQALAEMVDKAYKRGGTAVHLMDRQGARLLHVRGKRIVD